MVNRDVRKNRRHLMERGLDVQGICISNKKTRNVSGLNSAIYFSILHNIFRSIVK